VAVVPASAPELDPYLDREDIDILRFTADDAEIEGHELRVTVAGRTLELTVPFTQRHFATNLLAALTAYAALGLPLERAQEGVSRIALSRWRGEETALPGGGFVVNDAYNANPTSMRAALLDLPARARGRRRVAVLGEMAELGGESDRYHREIGELVAETVDLLVAVGPRARLYMEPGTAEMHWLERDDGAEDIVR